MEYKRRNIINNAEETTIAIFQDPPVQSLKKDHIAMFKRKAYSLHKCRHTLQQVYDWYRRNWKRLNGEELKQVEKNMEHLDEALQSGDREQATPLAKNLETFAKKWVSRNPLAVAKELLIALVLALAIATVVRQTWFELYQIPTGSMRPNLREKDHLLVSKTAFGLNIPIKPGHLYFDESLPKRTGIVIFSGHDLDMEDVDDRYFWLFPYTKRYIKRLIGKPGDSLYFYGGQIYGVDRDGEEIRELLNEPSMTGLEHIPFNHLEGRLGIQQSSTGPQLLLRHFDRAAARMSIGSSGQLVTQIHDGAHWRPENLNAMEKKRDRVEMYFDLYGMGNFAMARLLTAEQAKRLTQLDMTGLEKAPLYLELRHHPIPSLSQLRPQPMSHGGSPVQLFSFVSLIPLQKEHLKALMDAMYTNRFSVKDGYAIRYGLPPDIPQHYLPKMEHVSNGTYEFYYGKAYRVGATGATTELLPDHPLYNQTPANVQELFNLGIELIASYSPEQNNSYAHPSRYAYFRNGDLYLMGAPVLKKGDPTLESFIRREQERQQQATAVQPYVAFLDNGPPLLEDGTFDVQYIKNFGVKVPDDHYVMLGDNHAFSSDSRYFGFVPQANLRGNPRFILWPLGPRWGLPKQPSIPYWNIPTVVVWLLVAAALGFWYWWVRRKHHQPIFKKVSA